MISNEDRIEKLEGELIDEGKTQTVLETVIQVFQDSNKWCALVGENIQVGHAAFGEDSILAVNQLIAEHPEYTDYALEFPEPVGKKALIQVIKTRKMYTDSYIYTARLGQSIECGNTADEVVEAIKKAHPELGGFEVCFLPTDEEVEKPLTETRIEEEPDLLTGVVTPNERVITHNGKGRLFSVEETLKQPHSVEFVKGQKGTVGFTVKAYGQSPEETLLFAEQLFLGARDKAKEFEGLEG